MNSIGDWFKVTLFGESHQPMIGVVLEGVPPGIVIDEEAIRKALRLRNPEAIGTTSRKEKDAFTITSGIFDSKTTGSPLHISIANEDVRSQDYAALVLHPRPGHADFVASKKYHGFHDPRGGGRFSGRLTAPLVIAGTIAKQLLPFRFNHKLIQVGTLTDMSQIDTYLAAIQAEKDSVGGIIQLTVDQLPIGLGEPMFAKVESKLAQLLFSIPAVKGVEFGMGFSGITMKGSAFNDRYLDGTGRTATNHSGGISGGLTNGNPLLINVFVKPPSSIQQTQVTYSFASNQEEPLTIGGRHDVCIARRAGIVLESMVAIGLADLYAYYLLHERQAQR